MAYKGNWATGELIDATAFQELVNSAVYSFADLSTIQSSITSAIDGQIAFAQDTESYYRYDSDSTSWVALLGGADITAVTITTASNSGLSGGSTATSGAFTSTLLVDASNLSIVTASSSDYIVLHDVTDNSTKKALISDIVSLGDITAVNTASNSGLAGGGTSGDLSISVDPSNLTDGSSITVDTANDLLILEDVTDGTVYKVKPSQIASGSANALEDGDSDFTISDGMTNGIHYELDNTDVADWNNAGVQLKADGGIYHNTFTQSQNYTIASGTGAMAVGGLSFAGTVTISGTLVVL